jgi:hypothetical protein
MKAKENEFDYLEVARKTKAEYDEGKLTIPQIIEVMRPTLKDEEQHRCGIWQCVFEKDLPVCIAIELELNRILAQDSAKRVLHTIEEDEKEGKCNHGKFYLIEATAMLAATYLTKEDNYYLIHDKTLCSKAFQEWVKAMEEWKKEFVHDLYSECERRLGGHVQFALCNPNIPPPYRKKLFNRIPEQSKLLLEVIQLCLDAGALNP